MEKIVFSVFIPLLLVGIVMGLIIFMIAIKIYLQDQKRNEAREMENDAICERRLEREGKEKESPHYILKNNPSTWQLQVILTTTADSTIRQMAIEAALASRDIMVLHTLVYECDFVPESIKDRALMIFQEITFDKLADIDCRSVVIHNSCWDNDTSEWGVWWRAWKPKLEARARRAEYFQEQERIKQAQEAQLRQAEADGLDVCWDCKTISPRYFLCGCCTTCRGGGSYSGLCFIHDNSDDDDDDD